MEKQEKNGKSFHIIKNDTIFQHPSFQLEREREAIVNLWRTIKNVFYMKSINKIFNYLSHHFFHYFSLHHKCPGLFMIQFFYPSHIPTPLHHIYPMPINNVLRCIFLFEEKPNVNFSEYDRSVHSKILQIRGILVFKPEYFGCYIY